MRLTFENLRKAYGSKPALDGITGTAEGRILGLLGPNGAGKTTLMRMCVGLLSPDQGRLEIEASRSSPPVEGHTPRIGFVPERGGLFPDLTGLDSVIYSGRLSGLPLMTARLRSHEVLDLVGIEEARYRFVDSYSTGLRQRAKIAMALVHDPDIILLDEPTSGLDPGSRREILDCLGSLPSRGGPHVLLSTHLLNDVETMCDGCVILDRGTLRFAGALDDLEPPNRHRYVIRLLEPNANFQAALATLGTPVQTSADSRLLEFDLPAKHSADELLSLARTHGAVMVEVYPTKMPMEERFRRQLSHEGTADEG